MHNITKPLVLLSILDKGYVMFHEDFATPPRLKLLLLETHIVFIPNPRLNYFHAKGSKWQLKLCSDDQVVS